MEERKQRWIGTERNIVRDCSCLPPSLAAVLPWNVPLPPLTPLRSYTRRRARMRGPQGPDSYTAAPALALSLSLSLSRHSKLDRRFRSEAASVRPTHSPSGPRWDSLDRVDRLALLNARLRPDIKFANILQVSFVLSACSLFMFIIGIAVAVVYFFYAI